ncbi:MAG: hypothetical protein J1F01_06715 [Oscillospiraceae bacterium]|nr:hypothetical protein [Oscillospiraceae bacterium]
MKIMKQSKKKLFMAIGLITGVTILTSAALANYTTSNGYEVGKKSVKGLFKNENYTAHTEFALSVDGTVISKDISDELYDRNGDVRINREEVGYSSFQGDGSERRYKFYQQDDISISYYSDSTDDAEGSTYVHKGIYGRSGMFDGMYTNDEQENETIGKIIRFVELAGDTVVGDLKNNIVYVSGDDDSASYEINLDAIQIPELANAGLSAFFSTLAQNTYNQDDPYMILGTDPIVKGAFLHFTVDNEGRLTEAKGNVTVSGNGHEAAVDLYLTMSDYGTTVPQRVDISSMPNVTTYDEDGHEKIVTKTTEEGETVEIEYPVG